MKHAGLTKFREGWLSVFTILGVTLLAYAPLIGQLGYYRDDWYLLWTYESDGAPGLLKLFVGDRPFLGWLYIFDFGLLGSHPLGWQIYALAIKALSALALFWLLREIWPDRKIETTFVALLFVVYPGFYQQPVALTFKQLLLAYGAAMLSLAFTIRVIKADNNAQKIIFTGIALVLSAFYIFIYEPLIGLEAARLLLILFYIHRENPKWRESLRLAALKFIPYFVFASLFVFWRVFIFQSTRKAVSVESLAQGYTSLHGLLRVVVETFKDLIETSMLAWEVPYYQFTVTAKYRDMGFAFGLALLAVTLSAGYYFLVQKQAGAESEADHRSRADWLVLGAVIVLVTTLPVVAAGRNVLFGIQWDRYTYQSSLGVALLIGGFVFYALRGNLRWIVMSLFLISGVVTQTFSAMYYRDFWEAERATWWQLYWRAPQIADGATVIASLPEGYQLAEEYEAWGPLNLLYHRGEPLKFSAQVPYPGIVINLRRGLQEERLVRDTITVSRDYGRSLVISLPNDYSCLHVYNGALGLSTAENPMVALMAPYSRTDWIETNATPPNPPSLILGKEPDHRWCFYYEKINLALQRGDWTEASRLADEALAKDYRPEETSEWLPVLFAYANTGQEKQVKRVSTYVNDKYTRMNLCDQLRAVTTWAQGYRPDLVIGNLCAAQ